jgi:hypothetical protein
LKGRSTPRAAGDVPRKGKKTVIVYWLIPATAERELFRDLIRILAKSFEAPQFFPHLTVCRAEDRQPRKNRGSRKRPESPREVLRRVKGTPIRLRVRGVTFSPKFTKTLFLRFHSNAALEKLVVDLAGNAKSLRDPHLSLLYKKLPTWMKKELAAAIKLPLRQIVFDRLQAVRCPLPTKTRADVESWRTVATKRLSG